MNIKKIMKNNKEKAHDLIDKFCEIPSLSEGGWAKVDEKDILHLGEIIHTIIRAKYDSDQDGDYPINYNLIDRTKYEPHYYREVPYSHEVKNEEENRFRLECLMDNLQIATERLNSFLKLERYEKNNQLSNT